MIKQIFISSDLGRWTIFKTSMSFNTRKEALSSLSLYLFDKYKKSSENSLSCCKYYSNNRLNSDFYFCPKCGNQLTLYSIDLWSKFLNTLLYNFCSGIKEDWNITRVPDKIIQDETIILDNANWALALLIESSLQINMFHLNKYSDNFIQSFVQELNVLCDENTVYVSDYSGYIYPNSYLSQTDLVPDNKIYNLCGVLKNLGTSMPQLINSFTNRADAERLKNKLEIIQKKVLDEVSMSPSDTEMLLLIPGFGFDMSSKLTTTFIIEEAYLL